MTEAEVLKKAAKQLGWETCARTDPEDMRKYYKPGMTPEEVVAAWWTELIESQKDMPDERDPEFLKTLTCHDCTRRDDCEWVDDPYNTKGHCLADE